MNFINKIIAYLKNPAKIIKYFGSKGRFKFLPDRLYLKLIYRGTFGRKLDLENPKTFTEKIQWLKLYDRKPEYIRLVDKYRVRKYISETIGDKYLVPLIGIYHRFDEIDFDKLPDRFVLKCTHDSGSIVVCKDKKSFDKKAAEKKLKKCLKRNDYYVGREWPYKYVKPRIICEQLLDDGINEVPEDYKVYCFNGEPKYIFILHDRYNKNVPRSGTVYTADWELVPCVFDSHYRFNLTRQQKPECLEEILKLSRILCRGFAQVRIDFYIVKDRCYFGEITLSTSNGLTHITPQAYDELLGSMVKLPI
jgi:hypothetical protein